jgi:uncharacterized repeat protein (TIGR01451 family)
VACGDVNGDGLADIVTGAGAGGGPHVRAFSLAGGGVTEIASFFAYDPAFQGGVFVATGDVNGDGVSEIITGAGAGGGPHVRVLSMRGGVTELASFFAYDPRFAGGVSVAAGDVNGDGLADIVTGAGPGGGPHVRVLNASGSSVTELAGFFAYDPTFTGGVFVAAGDVNGDGLADIVTGPASGLGATVRAFTGLGRPIVQFNALESGGTAGPSAADLRVKMTGPSTAVPGALITFAIDVTNVGPGPANAVSVKCPPVPGLTLISNTGACTGGFPCALGRLGVGETRTILSTFAVDAPFRSSRVVNIIDAVTSDTDPVPLNNSAVVSTTIVDPSASARFVAVGDINGDRRKEVIVGAGAGGPPVVRIFSNDGADLGRSFYAYAPAFRGGVRVAACDVNGDGIDEIVTAAGPGGGPHVRVLSVSGSVPTELAGFYAYTPAFAGGVFVACGDVDGDGLADIVTGAGAGGGPHVRAFSLSGGGLTEIASFFAYDPAFQGGVFVATGDVNGDGVAEIVTGAGAGGGPHVRVLSVRRGVTELAGFFAYDLRFAGGVSVAAADINGDGLADIVTGAGPGGGPHVRVLSTRTGVTEVAGFYAYDPIFPGGVFVAAGDLNGDGLADIVTGPGAGGGPLIRVLDGRGTPIGVEWFDLR